MRNQLFVTTCLSLLIASSVSLAQVTVGKASEAATQDVESMPKRLPLARDGEVIDSVGGGAIEPVLPVVQKNDGISYITGGVGDEELAELIAQESNFNSRILLSSSYGEYLSDVAVRFLDKKNVEVLRVMGAGPFLYVNLPPGSYKVEAASSSGEIQSKKINVSAKPSSTGKTVIIFKD